MLLEPNKCRPASAHVVVLGNENGGSGKSTTAMHVAVALMNVGQRVATIDHDSRQRSLTRYMENRRAWARHAHIDLKLPVHFCVARAHSAIVPRYNISAPKKRPSLSECQYSREESIHE